MRSTTRRHSLATHRAAVSALLFIALLALLPARVGAQRGSALASLKTVATPQIPGVERYVRDFQALVALGKALFWDIQVGSDGRTACATCHFHAGADHRRQNQLAPLPDAAGTFRPNRVLTSDDFPFHQLSNPLDNRSAIVRDLRQVAGSAGVPQRRFVDVSVEGSGDDAADTDGQAAPAIGGLKLRQVTSRNAPSVVNAIFNVRNFWDGRASSVFTGATPFGDSDAALNVLVARGSILTPDRIRLDNASLASQSVGPALNGVEMSWSGRSWAKLGKRMLALVPLARQQVAADDSVLAGMTNPDGPGLLPEYGYGALTRTAFRPEYWQSSRIVDASGRAIDGLAAPRSTDEFTQMEFNYPVFWGLAIQAYEATLVSNDSRFDRFMDGNASDLTADEQEGLRVFQRNASQCLQCHAGPELTAASFTNVARAGFDATSARAFGFFRTAVSAIGDDVGAAGRDAFGLALFPSAVQGSASGAFKSPGLRNVELTGPYLHTGGLATLEQVMEFYARNGDVPDGGNLGPGMGNVRLNQQERTSLVVFMRALTDDRVRYERAPFDHPALCIPIGHPEVPPGVVRPDPLFPGMPVALDSWALIPAAGRGGNIVPLQTFEELLIGVGADGSRAHTLSTPCQP